MNALNKLYSKFHGSYFAFIGVGIAVISTTVAINSLYLVYPKIDLLSLWMSDLGASPCGTFFNISIIFSSIFLFLFILYYTRFLSKSNGSEVLIRLTLIFGFLSCFGLFLIGLFPVKYIGEASIEHSFAALIYWIGSLLFWLFLGILELKNPKISNRQSIIALITCFFWIFFLLYLVLILMFPILDSSKFPQWLVHIILVISLTEHGLYCRKKDKNLNFKS